MKRVLVVSDLHSGHRCGLTPPPWWYATDSKPHRLKWRKIQKACWEWYAKKIQEYKPFDAIIVNGDAIDGKNSRAGSTELLTADRQEQVDIAAHCIRFAMSKRTKVVIVRGTPYHTGSEEDWEDVLGYDLGAEKVGNHEYVRVDGVVFDCKHKVGASTIPHGRHTAPSRERLWGLIWAEAGRAPKGDVLIRSHVHYHGYCGGTGWLAVTTPALQAFGSKYGALQCSGLVDFGFLVFDVDGKKFHMEPEIAEIQVMKPSVLEV